MTKIADIQTELAAKRKRLAALEATPSTATDIEDHIGQALADEQDTVKLEKDLAVALKTDSRRLLTIEALTSQIAALSVELSDAEAAEKAKRIQAAGKRCRRDGDVLDDLFEQVRKAALKFEHSAGELFSIAEHPGGNRPADMIGKAVAAHLMPIAPTQMRGICHTAGLGTHAEQTGFPKCFARWADFLEKRATLKPKQGAVGPDAVQPHDVYAAQATISDEEVRAALADAVRR